MTSELDFAWRIRNDDGRNTRIDPAWPAQARGGRDQLDHRAPDWRPGHGEPDGRTETPAVIQLDWVVGLMNDSSPPTADGLRRHFPPGFLKAVSREQLLSALYPAWSERPVTVRRIRNEQSIGAVATLATRGASFQVTVTVEPTGSHRIVGLMLQPVAPKLTSWRSIDQSLSRLGRHVAL